MAVTQKTYRYEGFNAGAAVKVGLIEASSEQDAGTKLRELGLFVNKIELHGDTPMKTSLPGAEEQAEALKPPEPARVSSPKESHPQDTHLGAEMERAERAAAGADGESKQLETIHEKPAIEQLRDGLAEIGEFWRICIGAQLGPFAGALGQDVLKETLNQAARELVEEEYKQAFGVYRRQEFERNWRERQKTKGA